MRRPAWITDAPEIVEPLLRLRDTGVWELRVVRVPLGPLEDLATSIAPEVTNGDQHRLIGKMLEAAIPLIPRSEYQTAARILFDMNYSRVKSSTARRTAAAAVFGQSYSRFRDPEVGFERPLILSVAEAIQKAALMRDVPPLRQPLSRHHDAGVLPEDLMISRTLFHVARTLEVCKEHADAKIAEEIGVLIDRYVNWHQSEEENGARILSSFDALCRKCIGTSVYELIGQIQKTSPGPDNPPHRVNSSLKYPRSESLALIEGGSDPFTGDNVSPYYISYLPVTMTEWQDFLTKFGWEPSHTWRTLFNVRDVDDLLQSRLGRLPAVAMTYFDCVTYCFWLWLTTPYKFRLPTEAEWNFAATGGASIRYPWGDRPDWKAANFSTSPSGSGAVPVDAVPPSGPFDVVGLSGNTWEYVSTLWRGERPVANSEILWPDVLIPLIMPNWWQVDKRISVTPGNYLHDVKVVMKGGSWSLGPEYATVDTRIYSSLFNNGEYGGFRLAVDAVYDPETSTYVPEPSPFVNSELREVRVLSPKDLSNLVGDYYTDQIRAKAVITGCGGGSGPSNDPMSWEEIVRARFPSGR